MKLFIWYFNVCRVFANSCKLQYKYARKSFYAFVCIIFLNKWNLLRLKFLLFIHFNIFKKWTGMWSKSRNDQRGVSLCCDHPCYWLRKCKGERGLNKKHSPDICLCTRILYNPYLHNIPVSSVIIIRELVIFICIMVINYSILYEIL